MPYSNYDSVGTIIYFTARLEPVSVLDVGVGYGTYGFLLRQALDMNAGRMGRDQWKAQIDGVEIFDGYRNPVWDYAYNTIFIKDIRELLPGLKTYDVIICNDVLEHFPRAEARQLVKELLSKSSVLIATSPNQWFPQGAWSGNEAETHHCLLDESDFSNLVVSRRTTYTTCYFCSSQPRYREMIHALGAYVALPHVSRRAIFLHQVRRKWRKLQGKPV